MLAERQHDLSFLDSDLFSVVDYSSMQFSSGVVTLMYDDDVFCCLFIKLEFELKFEFFLFLNPFSAWKKAAYVELKKKKLSVKLIDILTEICCWE